MFVMLMKSSVKGNKYTEMVQASIIDENAEILIISAAIEAEINELDSLSEKKEFLAEIGLEEPGVNKIIRSAYSLLGLQTFLLLERKRFVHGLLRKGHMLHKLLA